MQITHWAMAGAVIGCIGCMQVFQNTKDKKLKGDMMFYHKSCGTLACMLLVPRLASRALSKIPPHVPGEAWEIFTANVTHTLLYGFMIFMPVSGVLMGYYSGKGLPFIFTTIKGPAKADGSIAKPAHKYHKLVGYYGQFLVPVHVGAVAYQYALKGRNILPRMFSLGK
eukprot:CAMPEP_0185022088 /NCGR_PEP_ID=MMETSP1103-20130426/4809_1 /TAXON_ID=36769 /ORGANISM="Paraphysomonas bandaiensis, Strain Caron Lab Isolate" /LENGTH=167 /DNA_ID=CAMNT_0027554005 /DNA_START=169 /DNA_END=672 /DNA_ORIENTATION=-